jgi:hypothetical protein
MPPNPTLRPKAPTLESKNLSKAQQLPTNIGQVAQLLTKSENTKNVLGPLKALESTCKPLDKTEEITAIYNSFNTKSSESKKKPAEKLLNIMLGRLVVTYNDPLLSKDIGLNLNQFNKVFNTVIFSSHVPTLNKYLEDYDVESFEYALASRLFSIRDQIQTKLNQQRQASQAASKETELTKLEARSRKLDERRASIQIKKKNEPTISPRKPNLAELNVISTTGSDQYLGEGMVHNGLPKILNEKASRLIIPTHFQPWLIKQISSCAVNEYGVNLDNNALDLSGSEYEEGIAQFANTRLVTGSKNRGATYTTAIVQMPNWSTADTQTKADLVAINYNRPLDEEEIKLQEVFYRLAEKIFTLSEEKLLVNYHDETPSKFGDIKTYIESLQLNNKSEILLLLSDYQAQIKTLIAAIRKISKDYLVNTTMPSIEDIKNNLNNIKVVRVITTSINEISKTLRNLEFELLDKRGLKPDLKGLQVKTSQIGSESHIEKNGEESTPVVIGNSPQAIQIIQATATDPKAEPSKALACSKYIKALELMCDDLLT